MFTLRHPRAPPAHRVLTLVLVGAACGEATQSGPPRRVRTQAAARALQEARNFADAESLLAVMLVILVIGIAVDSLCFGTLERAIRRRWGLLESTA